MMSMGGTDGLSPRSATWQNSTRKAVRTSAGIRTESCVGEHGDKVLGTLPLGAAAKAAHAGEHFIGVIQGVFAGCAGWRHRFAAWPLVPGRGG